MTESPTPGDLLDYQSKDPQQALDAAREVVRSYCGWHIAPSQSATVSVWSPDGCAVFLKTLNLTAVTSVTQDSVVLDPSTYTFESYGVIKRTPGAYFSKLSKVTVVFTHGYTVMPDDVSAVILGFAQRSLADTRGLVARQGATGPTAATVVETYGPLLSDADKDKLAPYALSAGFA